MACYSVWNEEERLPLSIRSIEHYVDKILLIDGRYKGFADELPVNSTDRTLEVANKFKNVEIIKCTEPLEIYDKFNLFWTIDADWYLWLDCDEILYGEVRDAIYHVRSKPDVPIWTIKTYTTLWNLYYGKDFPIPKIFRKGCGFKFCKEHAPYYDQYGNQVCHTAPKVPNVAIVGLTELRTDLHTQRKERYRERQSHLFSWW